jgi:alkaline phosphatase D
MKDENNLLLLPTPSDFAADHAEGAEIEAYLRQQADLWNESLFAGSSAEYLIDRRRFIHLTAKTSVAVAAGIGVLSASDAAQAQSPGTGFLHGVASGDPLPDRVIIWTRLTPVAAATPGSGVGPDSLVRWQVSRDRSFGNVDASGEVIAQAASDHTVKVDVAGLLPATSYFYRFEFDGTFAPLGQTRTAPAAASAIASLRFGVVSCSNFEGGFFSAYRHLARRTDLDFVLHLGDYIYEYETGRYGPGPAIGRVHDPLTEMISLEDYRRRHACYKRDPDLQALHARYAFIATWDDHEVTNDAWREGAENHQKDEGDYLKRRARAYQAYFEWMPIRLPDPVGAPTRIYRRFEFGNLADLSMLDLRQYRDVQAPSGVAPSDLLPPPAREIDDPDRTMTGDAQLDWIKSNLTASTTRGSWSATPS